MKSGPLDQNILPQKIIANNKSNSSETKTVWSIIIHIETEFPRTLFHTTILNSRKYCSANEMIINVSLLHTFDLETVWMITNVWILHSNYYLEQVKKTTLKLTLWDIFNTVVLIVWIGF